MLPAILPAVLSTAPAFVPDAAQLEVLRKQYQESLSDASIVKGQLEQRQQTLEEELGFNRLLKLL